MIKTEFFIFLTESISPGEVTALYIEGLRWKTILEFFLTKYTHPISKLFLSLLLSKYYPNPSFTTVSIAVILVQGTVNFLLGFTSQASIHSANTSKTPTCARHYFYYCFCQIKIRVLQEFKFPLKEMPPYWLPWFSLSPLFSLFFT